MTNTQNKTQFVDRTRTYVIGGLVASMVLIGGFGGWATSAKLSGAVVTPGQVVVSSNVKLVQHPDGGIVGDILVEPGDTVRAGEILISLDDALLRKNFTLLDDQLTALKVRMARLTAERDDIAELDVPEALKPRADAPAVKTAIEAERNLMVAHRATREGELAALDEQISQLNEDVAGLQAQADAKSEEIGLIDYELVGLESLFKKGHVPETRITALKRDRARLRGERGALVSTIAATRARMSEIELRKVMTEKAEKERVVDEISAIGPRVAELSERRATVELTLSRVDVRAPTDGVVHDLSVHTIGGVVQPGETLMQVVPAGDALVIEARISPNDIDKVFVGQKASLVIPAFAQKGVPQLNGNLAFVSADLMTDPVTGLPYYDATIRIADTDLELLGRNELALLPGMPAEVYITTAERTLAQYLIEPLQKQLRSTFREA